MAALAKLVRPAYAYSVLLLVAAVCLLLLDWKAALGVPILVCAVGAGIYLYLRPSNIGVKPGKKEATARELAEEEWVKLQHAGPRNPPFGPYG